MIVPPTGWQTSCVWRDQKEGLWRTQDRYLSGLVPGAHLSPAERRVLQLVGEHKTGKEIADILCRSVRTIEFHRARICEKLKLKGATPSSSSPSSTIPPVGSGHNPPCPYFYLQQFVGLPVGIP